MLLAAAIILGGLLLCTAAFLLVVYVHFRRAHRHRPRVAVMESNRRRT
jgi:hypothetical protein